MDIEAGTRIGKYEIQALIGEGGMGRVYRALDTELQRPAALKFLPAEFASDPRRMARFEQEARAASALNHPNILTVYEIGRADSARFFATELVEGVTLREHLAAQRPRLGEVLGLAAQVASALVAAHAAGIVHRDLKPENVMLRGDGYVKVVDFGLAKLAAAPAGGVDTEAATRALVNTDPGAVMGTVSYMSPEQARGEEVDARTDVWSLGVLLYEMLTGQTPFRGRSAGHTIVAIQDEEPPPLSRLLPDAPEALQEIVSDALSKDREARPTARQVLARLERLRRRLDAGAHLDHPVAPNSQGVESSAGSMGSSPHAVSTLGGRSGATTSHGGAATVPSAPSVTDPPPAARRRGRSAGLVPGLLAVALVGGVPFAAYRLGWFGKSKAPAGQMKITRLTSTGQASNAQISPDGKYVVHVKTEGGLRSLWLRQVETTSDTQILPPTDDFLSVVAFSPDGAYIYFVRGAPNSAGLPLYQMPLLGGTPRKLNENVYSAFSFSPDGRRMAFRRIAVTTGESYLMLANADGTGERVLAVRKLPKAFTGNGTSWSPDGKAVACTVVNVDAGGNYGALVEVDVESGAERRLTAERFAAVTSVAWLPDKSGLVFNASAEGAGGYQVWHLSYPDGATRRVTNDLNSYTGLSLSADGRSLVTVQSETNANIWVGPLGEPSRVRQITSGTSNSGRGGLSFAPDGRLAYIALEGGIPQIWIMGADGSGARQLTARMRNSNRPAVTPDGRHIVFRSLRTGTWKLWRMDLDGGNLKQLTDGPGDDQDPRPSPDGRWVIYQSSRAGMLNLWKVSIEGGEPVRLTEMTTYNGAASPDGRFIACLYREGPDTPVRIALIPFDGGGPVRLIDISQRLVHAPGLHWTPDGRSLLYADTQGGVSNIWSLPLGGGKPVQLTDFKSELVFFFTVSPDGKQFAASRGHVINDVVLISDFR